MKTLSTLSFIVLAFIHIAARSQTTHIITMPSTGNNTIDITCSVGDIIQLQSASTPYAIKIFRNPTPDFTVTVSGTSTSYTVTATDTSYSSIVSVSPVCTCRGKTILTPATFINKFSFGVDQNMVYSNPANNLLYINEANLNSEILIVDITGKICKEFRASSNTTPIDVSDYSNGIYFNVKEKYRRKFIKN